MKKYFYMAVLLIAAALTTTSCGDDEPKEKVTATATYSLTFSQDLLDACNVFITYKAENGRNVKDKITTTQWIQTVTSEKFPAEFGVEFEFSTKYQADLSKDNYDLIAELKLDLKTSKGALHSNSFSIINNLGVAKDKVLDTLEKKSGYSIGFKVTKDGNATPANLNYN